MRKSHNIAIILSCMALAVALICTHPAAARAAGDRGAGVSAAQLPEEVRPLTVQNRFIPGEGVPIGKVRKIRGHLIVRHGNAAEAYFAAPGDSLYANDELFTLKKTRVRIRFTTADIVNMGANSRIRVDELVDDRRNRRKKTKMSMLRGKAMFYVMRLMKYNKVDTQVRTPTAVCGVRGTKFAVVVRKKDNLFSGMPRYLADASGAPLPGLLADNGGGDSVTDMHMLEGDGYMTAGGTTVNLGSGESGTAGDTGPPSTGPTPQGMGRGLNNDTNPDADGDDGDGDDGDDGGDTGDDPNAAGDLGNSGTDTTNTLNQAGLVAGRPTQRIGYFAALLTRLSYYGSPISPTADHVYVSPSYHDHDAPGIIGTDISTGSDIIELDGSTDDTPTVTRVDTETGTNLTTSNGLGSQHKVAYTEVGYNQFLEWGYWVMLTQMIHSSGSVGTWVIDNAGVYVHGDPTPVENLNGIQGHYAGTAWGTLWTSSGGIALSGSMSADVALGSTLLKNLDVSVSDGGSNSVTIQQLPGQSVEFCSVSGTANLATHYGSGNVDMKINGATVDHGTVSAGLFGPNGEAMAGVAGAMAGSDQAVVGFEGRKQ